MNGTQKSEIRKEMLLGGLLEIAERAIQRGTPEQREMIQRTLDAVSASPEEWYELRLHCGYGAVNLIDEICNNDTGKRSNPVKMLQWKTQKVDWFDGLDELGQKREGRPYGSGGPADNRTIELIRKGYGI